MTTGLSKERLESLLNNLKNHTSMYSQLSTVEMRTLLQQALDQQATINKWYGFMTLMAKYSSWKDKIQAHLDEYNYGTTDKRVIDAALHYIERLKLLNK